jgi:succinate dehydrogenase / fumarate reductase flavoprotein subunit
MYEQFHALGDIDITKQPMEVYPTIHYTMGGLWTTPEECATSIPGLFAAGEVAAGLHGANRLGGNSLSDIIVFGKRAGEGAAKFAQAHSHGTLDESQMEAELQVLMSPLTDLEGENPYTVHQELQENMQKDAMIARTEEGLTRCLDKILELQQRAKKLKVGGSRAFNPGWHAARDVRFMLRTSEIIVRCALERKESRGGQWRLDYPNRDDAYWGKYNQIAVKDGDAAKISLRPLEEMPPELNSLFEKGK